MFLTNKVPFFPGGGTVWYKSNTQSNHFLDNCELREEGGTPNIIGIIHTGLLFVRKVVQQRYITQRMFDIVRYVDSYIMYHERELETVHFYTTIGKKQNERLPIYSFRMKGIHPGLFVKVLSDKYGIQARSGVSCCYLLAEQLCSVNKKERTIILSGRGTPDNYGWIRVTFHYTFTDSSIRHVLNSITELVRTIHSYKCLYEYKCSDNKWYNRTTDVSKHAIPEIVSEVFDEMRLISSV